MYQIYFIWSDATCFGRSFHSSSAVQDCTYSNRHMSNRYCFLFASKLIAVSVWLLYVQSWTADDEWKVRLKHVECHSKWNKFDTLVHPVGFTVGIYYDARPRVHQICWYDIVAVSSTHFVSQTFSVTFFCHLLRRLYWPVNCWWWCVLCTV